MPKNTNALIVLFNGPPRSGKDEGSAVLSNLLHEQGHSVAQLKLAQILKEITHRMYDVDRGADFFEDVKDQPNDAFLGLSPRQAYINVAEKLIKPVHGKTFFVEMLYKNLPPVADVVVISDLGFSVELDFLADNHPNENLIPVIVRRPGTDFGIDSREYVDVEDLKSFEIHNDDTLEQYHDKIAVLADHINKRLSK